MKNLRHKKTAWSYTEGLKKHYNNVQKKALDLALEDHEQIKILSFWTTFFSATITIAITCIFAWLLYLNSKLVALNGACGLLRSSVDFFSADCTALLNALNTEILSLHENLVILTLTNSEIASLQEILHANSKIYLEELEAQSVRQKLALIIVVGSITVLSLLCFVALNSGGSGGDAFFGKAFLPKVDAAVQTTFQSTSDAAVQTFAQANPQTYYYTHERGTVWKIDIFDGLYVDVSLQTRGASDFGNAYNIFEGFFMQLENWVGINTNTRPLRDGLSASMFENIENAAHAAAFFTAQ